MYISGVSASFTCLAFEPGKEPNEVSSFEDIERILARHDEVLFFDVNNARDVEFERLAALLDLHPLAVEDARKAHQRPKIEPYRNSWFIVVHLVTRKDEAIHTSELAIFCGDGFIVAVHDIESELCADITQRWTQRKSETGHRVAALLHAIFDSVVDSYIPIGEQIEKEIDALEETLFVEQATTPEIFLEVFRLKRDLSDFRRAVAPMCDVLNPVVRGELSGFSAEDLAYFRDIDDHVARLVDNLDGAKDTLINAREAHSAFASHRQNEVIKQLTIWSAIFFPLTFITGFFGQNFGWLVSHIGSKTNFFEYGIGIDIVAIGIVIGFLRYKRWF